MLFVIDFDGTLACADTVDTMLEKFAPLAWRDVEDDWLAGRITAVECMRKQMHLVAADRVTLESFFRAIKLDDTFLPFYRHVIAFSVVAIVSDGLDHAIRTATREAALPKMPIYANRLIFEPQGIDITFPHLDSQCQAGNGVCKCAVARALSGPEGGPVVLVGDGKSDACLAASADVVFAKGRLLDHCLAQGIAHVPFETFADVLATIRTWPKHLPRQAASFG
jgi:2-hydroxy-3-keto-5-methylthiopentenyl-1-phosphate phosphatase